MKRNELKIYKNSRQPVAYVVGQRARDNEYPSNEHLVHHNRATLDHNDGYIVSKSSQEACELRQHRSVRLRWYHNLESYSERKKKRKKKEKKEERKKK